MPKPSADNEFSSVQPLLCAESDLCILEARNGIHLAQLVTELAHSWCHAGRLQLTPEIICECNRVAMQGIYETAGRYRDRFVAVGSFVPPKRSEVPALVAEMCDYANHVSAQPLHASAFLLWRLNWVHPFYDGNGRIARELSYLALLVGNSVSELAGNPTIPELIERNYRSEYYQYLEAADRAWAVNLEPDVRELESMISSLLVDQIASASDLDDSNSD